MKIDYLLLDVFTTERFKGNPLAVVCKGDGLLDNEMQAIAAEFNLSETVFIISPKGERNTAALRIFTPALELPFAGHPTVGAAIVLGLQQKLSAVRLEEQVGLVTALVERHGKRCGEARFGVPQLPEEAGRAPERASIARALGLDLEDISCGAYQPAVFSAGVTFYLVPVRNAEALRRIETNPVGWKHAFPLGEHSVYAFTQTPEETGNDLAARMFSPGMGLGEDPATGAAAAALIGLLAQHLPFSTGQTDLRLRQGHEMGRPSLIQVQVRKENDVLVHGGIGGQAIIIGEGSLGWDD